VRNAIQEIMEKGTNALLPMCLVEVSPFSTRNDTPSVYVSFTYDFLKSPASAEPRFDLMGLWKEALTAYDQTWQVAWTPQRRGKDKRCWVCFPTLVDHGAEDTKKEAEKMAKKIAEWYHRTHKGHIVNHFGVMAGPSLSSPHLPKSTISSTTTTSSWQELQRGQ
jgi:hypothetical protein